jgi:hypothetical protein
LPVCASNENIFFSAIKMKRRLITAQYKMEHSKNECSSPRRGDKQQFHKDGGMYLHFITTGAKIVNLLLKVWGLQQKDHPVYYLT